MRKSVLRDHFLRHSAASLGVSAERVVDRVSANAYEQQLMQLAEDKRILKGIQSVERKAEVKRELLPKYQPWIEGALAGESGRQDDVLMTVFVWSIDIGDFDQALKIGAYAIDHGLTMPDQYERNVPSVLAEEIADYALKQSEAALVQLQPAIVQAIALTEACDMHDQVRAKLYKANGYALRIAGSSVGNVEWLIKARDMLTRALQLHDKSGVKKDIERLETLIKNSPPAENAGNTAQNEGG